METKSESITNPMRNVKIEKVTASISVGASGEPLEKAKEILVQIVGQKVCNRPAKTTIKEFGIRKGEPISCLVTLRNDNASNFLKRALEAVENKLKASNFDEFGNFSFGIKEHIEIPGVKYDPKLGIIGMDVNVTLERLGYRVKRRRIRESKVGNRHLITKEEAMDFFQDKFGIEITGRVQR